MTTENVIPATDERATEPALRMDAYYYGFVPTGVRPIDEVLSAVAVAGRAYHHTESWNEETEWAPKSHVTLIQEAADRAAKVIAELRGKQCRSTFRSGGVYDSDLHCQLRNGHEGSHEALGLRWPNWSLDFEDPRRSEDAIVCVSLVHRDELAVLRAVCGPKLECGRYAVEHKGRR